MPASLAWTIRTAGRGSAHPRGTIERSGTIMKKVATVVTVAVLALGLAACNKNDTDNNAANETAVENTASTDVNAATNDSVNAADAALNATDNSVANASNALQSANTTAANATENK